MFVTLYCRTWRRCGLLITPIVHGYLCENISPVGNDKGIEMEHFIEYSKILHLQFTLAPLIQNLSLSRMKFYTS